jgi:hypothetical protein
MQAYEICKVCVDRLASESELMLTLYLQICGFHANGKIFRFNEKYDLPSRALVKKLETSGYVKTADTGDIIPVLPEGCFLLELEPDRMVIKYYCSCGE